MNDPNHPDAAQDARRLAAARMGTSSSGLTYLPEREMLWSAREGQVANLGVYVITALTFWLILPLLWAGYRYLRTRKHRYELTDQRFLEHSGIIVHRIKMLELYRVIDIRVDGTIIQSFFRRGQVKLLTQDKNIPHVTINAIAAPAAVANRIRDAVERCRVTKGVRSVDV